MVALKAHWWKILLAVLVSVLVDVILHKLFAPRIEYDFPPSFFVEKGLFLPAATVALIIWFGTLAVVFAFIQDNLPGNRVTKGLRYGVGFAGLCFLAIFEMCLIFDSPVADELRTAVADGISILLLGLLLGRLTGTGSHYVIQRTNLRRISIIVIPLIFVAGRYFGYGIVHIMSAYSEKPITTFLWTLGIGWWIAIMYWLLRETNQKSSVVQAFRFGVQIFGSYWLIYNLFVLLFVRVSVSDVFVRVIIDVLSVTVGIWGVNKLSRVKTIQKA
jgi:Na+-transporting NADH:ubiquinone oxidoreductase subunit NqrE